MRLDFRWKLLALLGIGLFLLGLAGLVSLALHNLLLLLVLAVTVVLLVQAAWLVFAGTGRRYRQGLWLGLLGIIALVAEIFFFAKDSRNIRTLLLVALAGVVYAGVFILLRIQYWHVQRELGATKTPINFKKPFLIINPKAGNGRAVKAHIAETAAGQGIEVATLQKGEDMEEIARAAIAEGADVIGISGGDGSIGAVAKIAIEQAVPLVVLPGGTRCHFARDIGLDPARIGDALEGFHGVERRVDVGSIHGRIFLNNASFGVYGDIVSHPEYRDNKRNVIRKVLQDVLSGASLPYSLRFQGNGKQFSEAVLMLVGVNRYNTVNLLELGHRESLDEGVLQVNVIPKLDDTTARSLLSNMSLEVLGSHKQSEAFEQWTTSDFKVGSTQDKLVVGVDGEMEEHETPVTVACLPGALQLYVPAEGNRPRPGNIFSLIELKRMWHAVTGKDI